MRWPISCFAPADLPPTHSSVATVDEVNHDITLQFRTLALRLTSRWAGERLLAALSGFFGALALSLAVIGLYGVMSYNAARRRMKSAFTWRLCGTGSRAPHGLSEVAIRSRFCLIGAVSSTSLLASFLYRLGPAIPQLWSRPAWFPPCGCRRQSSAARRASIWIPATLREECCSFGYCR
jgi:hypothetical protein